MMWLALPAGAQILKGDWVDESAKQIDEHRKTRVRVIIVDAKGQPAGGAKVRLELLQHEFRWGVVADPKWFDFGTPRRADGSEAKDDGTSDDANEDAKGAGDVSAKQRKPTLLNSRSKHVWRAINAVSLHEMTAWTTLSDKPGVWDFSPVERALVWARMQGLGVRWGGVISGDVGRVPSWIAKRNGKPLAEALRLHTRMVMRTAGGQVDACDLLTDQPGRDFVDDRLGMAMWRRLFEQAKADAPRTRRFVRYVDTLSGRRLSEMNRHITDLRDSFVPLDGIAIEAKFRGLVLEPPVTRSLDSVATLKLPVVLTDVEIGGTSAAGAAVNTEMLMRLFFARPYIEGVYFKAMMADRLTTPHAGFIDDQGQPTAAGEVFDALARKQWWTDETRTADFLGNVRTRVFAGRYRITATLEKGTQVVTEVDLSKSDEERLVVMSPVKYEVGEGKKASKKTTDRP